MLQQAAGQPVLASPSPQLNFFEQLGGGEFAQTAAFGSEVGQAREIGEHFIQFGPGILIPLGLQVEPHDAQSLV